MIFPKFDNMHYIEEIRKKYDPLVEHVSGHITLAFTFESNLSSQKLKEHLSDVLLNYEPFKLTMNHVTKIDNQLGKYLFLLIDEGLDQVKELSEAIYTGILESYKPSWLTKESYLPHMTLGVFSSKNDLDLAFEDVNDHMTFETVIDKISVEIIADNEDSIIDFEIEIRK